MSAVEMLRAATDRLDALDQAAVPGPWTHYTAPRVDQLEGPLFVIAKVQHPKPGTPAEGTPGVTPGNADLIAALRSVAAPLAALLRGAAELLESNNAASVPESALPPRYTDALAVARAVLGVAS